MKSNLYLGGAQLGMRYGLAQKFLNHTAYDPVPVLKLAAQNNIEGIDLAQAYGHSESLAAAYLKNCTDWSPKVISKIDPMYSKADFKEAFTKVKNAVFKFGKPFDVIMLHNADHISDWHMFLELFESLREAMLVKEFGTSVYTPEEFALALNCPELKHIQFPMNLFDTRVYDTGAISLAEARGIKLYIRSIFLQGLLLMPGHIASQVKPEAKPAIDALHSFCRDQHQSPKQMAINFVRALVPSASLVIGFDNPFQFAEVLKITQSPIKPFEMDVGHFKEIGKMVNDPRNWITNQQPEKVMH